MIRETKVTNNEGDYKEYKQMTQNQYKVYEGAVSFRGVQRSKISHKVVLE